MFTEQQIPKLMNTFKQEIDKVAGQQPPTEYPLGDGSEVVILSGVAYFFGSELDCLRLFYAYNKVKRNENTRMGFSTNQNSWYFSLEPRW